MSSHMLTNRAHDLSSEGMSNKVLTAALRWHWHKHLSVPIALDLAISGFKSHHRTAQLSKQQ